MTSGMYFSYGEMRRVALELAIDTAPDDCTPEQIVDRATVYYFFLTDSP